MVINKIKDFLGLEAKELAEIKDLDQIEYAAAALLIEVAAVDKKFELDERAKILEYVKEKFSLEDNVAQKLISKAEAEVEGAVQLYGVTKALRNGLDYKDRVELMTCLWTIAYADGEADPFEDQLMRRIGELIYVTDRDRGEARKRAIEKLTDD